jgi:NADH dehydrogenase (ubiquinone) 1 alpha subcomplex subunit 9
MQLFCRIQPVYVVDVAAAIINSLKDGGTCMGKTYELGGPDVYTVHELVIVTNLQLLL